jgi:hypothetical protein
VSLICRQLSKVSSKNFYQARQKSVGREAKTGASRDLNIDLFLQKKREKRKKVEEEISQALLKDMKRKQKTEERKMNLTTNTMYNN